MSGAEATLLEEYPPGSGNFVYDPPGGGYVLLPNPQITGEDGFYEWYPYGDVGKFKVQVLKTGYIPGFTQEFTAMGGEEYDIGVMLQCDSDDDADGLYNYYDNCPAVANPGQEDGDADGSGDICDNCPLTANPIKLIPTATDSAMSATVVRALRPSGTRPWATPTATASRHRKRRC